MITQLEQHHIPVPGVRRTDAPIAVAQCAIRYTGNHGDLQNPSRRPRLQLDWTADAVRVHRRIPVHLENGRFLVTKRIKLRDATHLALGFAPDASGVLGPRTPTLEVRGGRGDEPSAWQPADRPLAVAWEWVPEPWGGGAKLGRR